MRTATLLAAASLAAAVAPGAARANCAAPVTYDLAVEGNTVTVQPTDPGRGCPDAGGMLRRDLATGDTVRLADFCGAPDPQGYFGAPYVDECVPPGTYWYGFAEPYDCQRGACGTFLFQGVSLVTPLPAGCERSAGNAPPTPVAEVPWTAATQMICGYGGADEDSWPFGCATAPGAAGAVAALDGLVLGAGLLLLRRRARRR